MQNSGARVLLASVVLLLTGCSHWPPVVESAKEVKRLSKGTEKVRARGLPNDELASLERLQKLHSLNFGGGFKAKGAKIDDEGLAILARLDLPELRMLNLSYNSNITDRGLMEVSRMSGVTSLSLMACPNVTDQSLEVLVGMTNLLWLNLRGCPGVTDAGLNTLAAKTNWAAIQLGGCSNVTDSAVATVQAALPRALVEKNEWEWSFHR
jgi:hypothetical protein